MGLFKNEKAVNGNLVKLHNKDKKISESNFYYAMWIEDKFDNNERCLLLSKSDLKKIKKVKYFDFKDKMDKGKLYRIGNSESYFIKIRDLEKSEVVVRLNNTVIKAGLRRAKKNPEDIPEKSFLQNLLD